MTQAAFAFRRWGGRRKGAGRKPVRTRAGVRHRRRAVLKSRFPVHVTWRMRDHVWSLRSRRCFGALARAFWGGCNRFGFRLVHYSVQGNHVHLLVEAQDERAQSRDAATGEGARRSLSRADLADADGGAARARVSARQCGAALRARGGGSIRVAGGGRGAGDLLGAEAVLAGAGGSRRGEAVRGEAADAGGDAEEVAGADAALDFGLAEADGGGGDVELGELGAAEGDAGRALDGELPALELGAVAVEADEAPAVPQGRPQLAGAVDGALGRVGQVERLAVGAPAEAVGDGQARLHHVHRAVRVVAIERRLAATD